VSSELGHAGSFLDLVAYQKARKLAQTVFEISKGFPSEEKFALTDQIRRAARSIGSQIAEGWGKRRYEKHFVSKLTDADGEQYEVRHWIIVAYDCGYITRQVAGDIWKDCEEIGRLIGGMIAKSDTFCGTSTYQIKESAAEYFTNEGSVHW